VRLRPNRGFPRRLKKLIKQSAWGSLGSAKPHPT
jgi:hypothetical protein